MPAYRASRTRDHGRWLTLSQACRVLGVDQSTLRRWADGGHVHAFRTPGGHRRFAEADLQALLAGRGPDGRRYQELGDLAITRIRRQLHRRPARDASWYASVDNGTRERLGALGRRPARDASWYASVDKPTRERLGALGRRLAALAAEYLGRRTRRAALLKDARALGDGYGRELAASGLPLAQAVQAFIFFRRSLDDVAQQATQRSGLSPTDALQACEQVIALADEVLVGLTEVYDASRGKEARKTKGRRSA